MRSCDPARREPVRKFVFRNFSKEAPLFAVLLGLNMQRTNGWPTLSSYLIVLAMVGGTLVVEEGLVHKGLNSRVMVWIGTVSYSAYVWQEMFMTRPGSTLSPFGLLAYFPFNLICVRGLGAVVLLD